MRLFPLLRQQDEQVPTCSLNLRIPCQEMCGLQSLRLQEINPLNKWDSFRGYKMLRVWAPQDVNLVIQHGCTIVCGKNHYPIIRAATQVHIEKSQCKA